MKRQKSKKKCRTYLHHVPNIKCVLDGVSSKTSEFGIDISKNKKITEGKEMYSLYWTMFIK
jgi:2-phosphoglycerate kinase